MKDPIIVEANVKSKVRLEKDYEFQASVTIGLADGGDFYLIIEFLKLTKPDLKTLARLSKVTNRLSIKSELFEKEQYRITHIVVTKVTTTSGLTMIWECRSDDPSSYDGLTL